MVLRFLPKISSKISCRLATINIIINKILDENAQQYVALWEDFIMDRLRLDILTKILRRMFNENPCSTCVPWIFGGVASEDVLE